ncbi:MAG: hypothetical protein KBA71_05720 [Opitutaceae bacterium]|nr:hypothetical protein [Opitutaceae bacterium]
MNLRDALGFAAVGGAMKVAPDLFPSVLGSASSAEMRSLWLAFMSYVLFAVAAAYFLPMVSKGVVLGIGHATRLGSRVWAMRRRAPVASVPARARVSA